MPSLPTLLAQPPIVVAPGCYDALSALMIERAGFPAAYFSGASLAYTRFGRPDVGLIAVDEVVDAVAAVRERVMLPLIVDCDTGFGNALNVMRTVKTMARAGASAIQLEDQTSPKRCGHLADKRLIGTREMVGKLKAALDARPSEDVLIIARTDAIAVEGFDAALDRAEASAQAGADLLFIEAPRNDDELAGIARRFAGCVPMMANMVEGGKTPLKDAATLQALAFALVISPGGPGRALPQALGDFFGSLRQHGTTAPFRNRMLDFAALNELIGTPEMLALGRRYDPEQMAREK